jgi:hypothetical protein
LDFNCSIFVQQWLDVREFQLSTSIYMYKS